MENLGPEEQELLRNELKYAYDKRCAEDSLASFVAQAWHVIEPETDLIWNWHIDTVCAYLEAAFHGRISPRLIINIPPGTMKSIIVSVMFPAWIWIHQPGKKFLCGSNGQTLATRDAVRMRDLCNSTWYQERWGDIVEMNPNVAGKELFGNLRFGYRESQGVTGAVTGKRGDFLFWDDAHDAKKTETVEQLEVITTAWDKAWCSRLNNLKTSLRIIIMQRVAFKDITGHLMDKDQGWTCLAIPMRYDSEVVFDAGKDIGRPDLNDPRTKEGELLFEERFDEQETLYLEQDLGPYDAAGQMQQRPSPKGGGEMRREWLCHYKTRPAIHNCVIIVDPAGEKKKGSQGMKKDNTGIVVVGIGTDGNYYLLDAYRDRLNLEERTTILFKLHHKYRPNGVFYERYGKDSDIVYIRSQQELLNYRFQIFELGGSTSKIDRIKNLIPIFSRGEMWLPETLYRTNHLGKPVDIIEEFIEVEYLPFPVGRFDDLIDALARITDIKVQTKLLAPMAQPAIEDTGHNIKNKSVGY